MNEGSCAFPETPTEDVLGEVNWALVHATNAFDFTAGPFFAPNERPDGPSWSWGETAPEPTIASELAARPAGVRPYNDSPVRFQAALDAMEAGKTIVYGDPLLGVEHRDKDVYHVLVRGHITDLVDSTFFVWSGDPETGERIGPLPRRDVYSVAPSERARLTVGDQLWLVIRLDQDMAEREARWAREAPWMARGSLYGVEWWERDVGDLLLPVYVPHPAGSLIRWPRNQELVELVDLSFDGTYAEAQQELIRAELRRWVGGEGVSPIPSAGIDVFEGWVAEVLSMPPRERRLPSGKARIRSMPPPRLVKTAAMAEVYAAEVMQALGFDDAYPTPPGADSGIDVVASAAVAQVKMEGVSTGRPQIQALFGVAAAEKKRPIFFSLAGYTEQALEWADRVQMPCFEFAFDGSIQPRNNYARTLFSLAQ